MWAQMGWRDQRRGLGLIRVLAVAANDHGHLSGIGRARGHRVFEKFQEIKTRIEMVAPLTSWRPSAPSRPDSEGPTTVSLIVTARLSVAVTDWWGLL